MEWKGVFASNGCTKEGGVTVNVSRFGMLFVFSFALLLPSCGFDGSDPNVIRDPLDLGGFCGRSTEAECDNDKNCIAGGCSGELCQHYTQMISTVCLWQDCYSDEEYGVKCGCVEGKCQWYKEVPKD